MPDIVECAECGNRYDSDVMAFCTRCGSDKGKGLAGAVTMSQRDLPVRRRVQMGGVVLVVLALVFGGLGAYLAFAPATALELTAESLAASPGGTVSLNVTANGTGQALPFAFEAPNGTTLANGTTDANGTWQGEAPAALSIVVVTGPGNATWQRTVVALEGSEAEVDLDLATDAMTAPGWVGFPSTVAYIRGAGVFLAVLGAFMAAGGVAALRVQGRGLMLAGATAALVPAIIMTVASPVGGFLLLIPAVAAFFLVLQARRLS